MLYYELKKLWVKPGTKIVLLILAVTLAVSCYFAIHGVYYVNENGENEYGIEAIHKLKAAKKDGAGLLIQASPMGWKSFYLITNWQEYLLIVFGGYIGTLFILLLTMLVSARTKSSVIAVTIPFILLFLPSFIGGSSMKMINKILGILPDRLLDINQTANLFALYQIGGKVMGSLHVLPVLYGGLALLLIPIVYQVYRRLSAG